MRTPAPPRRIDLAYVNNGDETSSTKSALQIVYALFPEWEDANGKVELVRFTDGITNTLLKAQFRTAGASQSDIDAQAVLLRAYGNGTEILIDRERETASHLLLSAYNLAPALLARFHNGMVYRFIQGSVTSPSDLRKKEIYTAVARRLGEWHAILPLESEKEEEASYCMKTTSPTNGEVNGEERGEDFTMGMVKPNIWTVMAKWVRALPEENDKQRERKTVLAREVRRSFEELGRLSALGENGMVMAHNDLLSGNVIIAPSTSKTTSTTVSFIDYEYASAAPAAFDLANHFSEWGGFACDYTVLPVRSTRRDFLSTYLESYGVHHSMRTPRNSESNIHVPISKVNGHMNGHLSNGGTKATTVDTLFEEVDRFRGIPGLYWGIWALIQSMVSKIDFDYKSYAEFRLAEYWCWRAADQDVNGDAVGGKVNGGGGGESAGRGAAAGFEEDVWRNALVRERRWNT